ncbi:MAG: hypothetical protein JNK72_19615 [Myxococcales bacterium]|nr:hypothetical protein [Myxococcales bacterium]
MLNDEAVARARAAIRANQPHNAVSILFNVAGQTHLPAREYDEILRVMGEGLEHAGLVRAAATVWLYLKETRRVYNLPGLDPRDRARAAWLDNQFAVAAQQYVEARWPAHAAVAYERARKYPEARALWEDVAADPALREDPYTAALVSFNLGRVLAELGDAPASHRCRVKATRLLEEAADLLEARGLRERAFDCFQVLLTLGSETGSFENLAEGYLNCIRILKEDHLKYYALQYYEDFLARADRAKEFHAVATILHEAADYARGLGMPFHPRIRVREAEAWRKAAEQLTQQGGAVELAENALLASVGAYSAVGLHGRAVGVFSALAALPGADEKRGARYKRLAERYASAADEESRPAALPEYLKTPVVYPDIWNADVVEWEERGDAVEACGEILLETTHPDFVRRKALLARLIPLIAREPNHPATMAQLAEALGQVQIYQVLAPLEALYERGRVEVKVSALRAARTLFFKRTFSIVFKGVADSESTVRVASMDAIAALHFPHAFDPLSRLHRDSADATIRQAALGSIGKIPSLEAVEYLLGVLLHGSPEERQHATDLLVRAEAVETQQALQNALAQEGPEVQQLIVGVLRRRNR